MYSSVLDWVKGFFVQNPLAKAVFVPVLVPVEQYLYLAVFVPVLVPVVHAVFVPVLVPVEQYLQYLVVFEGSSSTSGRQECSGEIVYLEKTLEEVL
ncbi:Serine/threonine-protein kinase pkn1, partial [Dissostichus eleginoides]